KVVQAPAAQGFGITLIKQTLQSRGGEASLSYRADGVTCSIRLPLPIEESTHLASLVPTSRSSGPSASRREENRCAIEGQRILVIEDEPLVSMDIEASLCEGGCNVVGPAGTLQAAKRLIAEAGYDAALLDVNLSGQPVDELAAALRQRGVPFAFVTGHGR